jgi:outer membrane receptor protein involved in Fe transport
VLGGVLAERSSLNGNISQNYFYPKIGAAYSLIKPAKSGEPHALDAFESLRVRAAYGETGNRPNYGDKFTSLTATGNINGNPGLVVNTLAGDADIEPERQREFEAGVDLATKDQRVVVELTGYQRNISNMLLQRSVADSTGFATQFTNGGSLRNRGVEAAVAVKPVATSAFDWTSRATLTLNRSMVTDLPSDIPPFNTGFTFGQYGSYRIETGKSATQILAGVNGEQVVVGDGEPDFRIGWSNVINAGDFTLSTLVDWQQGSEIMNLTRSYYDGNGTAPDPEAAAMRTELFPTDARVYIEDASFVKVREVSVGYNLPKRLATQLGPLKTLQLTVSGRNLLTFTHYTGLDPEVSNFGAQAISRNVDVTPFPPSRTFWFSVTAGI